MTEGGGAQEGAQKLERNGRRMLVDGVIANSGMNAHPDWFTHKAGLLHVVATYEQPWNRLELQTDGLFVSITEKPAESNGQLIYFFEWQFATDIQYKEGIPAERFPLDPHFLGRVTFTAQRMVRAFLGKALLQQKDIAKAQREKWDCTDWDLHFIRFGECLNIPMAFPGPLFGGVSFALYKDNEYQPAIRKTFPALAALEQCVD